MTTTQQRPLALLESELWRTVRCCSPAVLRRIKTFCFFSCDQLCSELDTTSAQNQAINSALSPSVLFHPTLLPLVLASPNDQIQPHPSLSSVTFQLLSLLFHPDSISQFHQFLSLISASLTIPSEITFHFLHTLDSLLNWQFCFNTPAL